MSELILVMKWDFENAPCDFFGQVAGICATGSLQSHLKIFPLEHLWESRLGGYVTNIFSILPLCVTMGRNSIGNNRGRVENCCSL